jgi:hypothetical protein
MNAFKKVTFTGLALLVVAVPAFAAEKNAGKAAGNAASKTPAQATAKITEKSAKNEEKTAKSAQKNAASASASSAAASASAKPVAENYVGYLVDRSCCAMMQQQGKDPIPALKAHFRSCSLEPSCCEAGYAIYSKGRFFDLDAKGNALAKKYFEGTKINAGHMVKITGTFRRNELKTESLAQSG